MHYSPPSNRNRRRRAAKQYEQQQQQQQQQQQNGSPPKPPPPSSSSSSRHGNNNSRYNNNNNNNRNNNRNNTSTAGPKRDLLVLLGSLLCLAVWYLTPISDQIVQIMLVQVPIEADKELAQRYLKNQQQNQNNNNNDPFMKYHHTHWSPMLRSIGWQLVASSQNPAVKQYDWDFGVLRDADTVNAFALPGGMIRVTSGLLDELQLSEGQLAALIGHEMGHVVHRHSQARIVSQQILSHILRALVYQDDDPHQETFGEAIGELLLQSADWLGQQSFSRSNEYQADAFSWDLLVETEWYNPESMKTLLKKLWDHHGQQGGTTSWDSTHPGTLDRIHALEEKWNMLDYQDQQQLANKMG